MKPISVYVAEEDYRSFKALAARRGKPVAELIRQAMAAFLERERPEGRPLGEIPPHPSGRLLRGWTREELFDEMLER
ncbi:MAG: ribbon-helix-helix domain-containing protein [Holophagales bacterium]|nr:ribbon-helix-helix domain-containing protein [Holophagales bacterium]